MVRWNAIAVLVLLVAGCSPKPRVQRGGPAASPSSKEWIVTLYGLHGQKVEFTAYDIGRGSHAIRKLPANKFASDINVIKRTRSRAGDFLAYEFVPVGADGWRVGLAQRRGRAYRTVAVSDHAASWIDWAVASPDGTHVAAWVADKTGVLHLMRRKDNRLEVVSRGHPEAVKAFPSFSASNQLAARLPIKREGEQLVFVNSIGGLVHRDTLACKEVQFSAKGDRWAYAGQRKDGWYIVLDEELAGPFDEIADIDLDGPEYVRARVRKGKMWSWVLIR